MSGARFLVIVPTYNERDNLSRKVPLVLEQAHSELSKIYSQVITLFTTIMELLVTAAWSTAL